MPFTIRESPERLEVSISPRHRAFAAVSAAIWILLAMWIALTMMAFGGDLGLDWWLWLVLALIGAASSLYGSGRAELLRVTPVEVQLDVVRFGQTGRRRVERLEGRVFAATTKPPFLSSHPTLPMLVLPGTALRVGSGMLTYDEAADLSIRIREYVQRPA